MRVEQQNANIVDTVKQMSGPEENTSVLADAVSKFSEKAVERSAKSDHAKSVNVKDATYMKPQAEEKKTAADEITQSQALDAGQRKEQMAVLSNTTSPEDYAKMQEDGFSLDETATNTIVTEVDKIKAQLAKAGVDISFFGDDLDIAQLEAITGSAALAVQIAEALQKADVPCTQENVKDAMEALALAEKLQKPGDGAVKYMLDNGLEPTIENLYMAQNSGSGSYQGNSGFKIDMTPFMDQVETIIHQSGYPVNDQTKADCQWMLENGVPLNEENLKKLEVLRELEFPIDADMLVKNIATAVAEGTRPQNAQLIEGNSLKDQAKQAYRIVTDATDADVAYVVDRGMDMSVRNLAYAMANRAQTSEEEANADALAKEGSVTASEGTAEESAAAATGNAAASAAEPATIKTTGAESYDEVSGVYTERGLALLTARRQLEEARLAMTVEANFSLLKRGVQIDTQPLAALVEQLKSTENAYYENLLKAQGVDASIENVALFRETTEKVTDLKSVPAYVLGMQEALYATVGEVHEAGRVLRDTFEKANERYETLMTAPRPDLGDSIEKAFRNVDDILTDIGLEASEANRRAVRILGYNQLEITPESVAEMKAVDEEVQRTFKNLTPAVVTKMIKQGINPLDMDFATLNQTAEQMGDEKGAQDNRKFGEFLWKLERSEGISEEERASYIGTYRLIHQVEQSDGAAVGALVNQGAEITMRNLMMAVRSERRGGKMDYAVDESFEGLENSGYMGTSITDQIEASYQNNCLKDIADTITPDKLKTVMLQKDWDNMSPEQLKEALAQAESNDEQLNYTYAKEQLGELAQSAKTPQDIYEVLQKYDIPNTMSNVMAMEAMIKNRNGMFRQIFGKGVKDADEEVGSDDIESMKQAVLEEFGDAVSSPEELAEAQEQLQKVAENVMKTMIERDDVTSVDVREMRLLSAQLSINSLLSKEEQYSVPVQVSDGVVNVSLKVVRGTDQKGVVDVMMETGLRGRIAATFQAKEQGITGLIVTNNPDTKAMLEAQNISVQDKQGGEVAGSGAASDSEVRYAYISDLDFGNFSMGMFGVDASAPEGVDKESENYQIQTTRLYHIAESFIQQIREVL